MTPAILKLQRFENFRRAQGGWPIPFGDAEAIHQLKTIDEEAKLCGDCDGEGVIECHACNGSGKSSEAPYEKGTP